MLSFANDGYPTALKIASALRSTTNKKGFPIGVLMLCENDDIIQGNPGQIIPDILSKVSYLLSLTKTLFITLFYYIFLILICVYLLSLKCVRWLKTAVKNPRNIHQTNLYLY